MTATDRRDPANAALRAQIDRLRALHARLQSVSQGAAEQALAAVRGMSSQEDAWRLQTLIQRQTQQIRPLLRSLEKDTPSSLTELLTPDELNALLGDGQAPGA